jgi:HK97 family phage major capsid protein
MARFHRACGARSKPTRVRRVSRMKPDVASGSLSIAFGNFQLAYVIVDKAGIRFLRDPFTDKPNLLFYAYRRCGGSLANSEALKLMKTGTS